MCGSDPTRDQFVSSWALVGYRPSKGFLANGLGIVGFNFLFNPLVCSDIGLPRVYCVSFSKHNPLLGGLWLTASWMVSIGSLLNTGLLNMVGIRAIWKSSSRWEKEPKKVTSTRCQKNLLIRFHCCAVL